MLIEANKKMPKNAEIFFCEYCDFKCFKKSNYDKHLLTRKHMKANKMLTNANEIMPENANLLMFICNNCNKNFKHSSSLSRHKNKCQTKEEIEEIDNSLNEKEIIMTLLNQNNQLQNQIIELCKENKSMITNNITNTNSHNKTFNLNVFLNETCKDAMNIMDFVDSIKLQITDLEKVGKIGYVEGISNIIVKNLNSLDETKRPVHCTDTKREVMYIKDDDKWEKENENKQKMRKVIKHIAHKNSKLLNEFKNKHPDCGKSDSRYSDQYNKLVIEAMGGKGDNDLEKEDKIIRNIAKEVTIDK
jgi:hypothetical protein